MWRFGRCCGVRYLSPSSRFTHDSKHETLIHDVLYSYSRVCGAYNQRKPLKTRLKMAQFVLVFDKGKELSRLHN